ncbi:hypothetical protein U1839_01765 [Sphingomonas sp. RT2P30]|uniref:hypothetical protein n=1 Tax=Parasphingomonas halimpatiens TaxID=3096162 RepID=UPI002FCC7D5B
MTDKPWTFERRKRLRLKRARRARQPICNERPGRFGLRASLAEIGGIARLLRRHGLAVTVPALVSPAQWKITATVPDALSDDRLLRLCQLIDRTRSLGLLTSVNVRLFRWLGKDRRQPARFYHNRNRR